VVRLDENALIVNLAVHAGSGSTIECETIIEPQAKLACLLAEKVKQPEQTEIHWSMSFELLFKKLKEKNSTGQKKVSRHNHLEVPGPLFIQSQYKPATAGNTRESQTKWCLLKLFTGCYPGHRHVLMKSRSIVLDGPYADNALENTQRFVPWQSYRTAQEPCIGQPTAKGYAETYVDGARISMSGIVLRHMQESGDDLFSFTTTTKLGSICPCEDIG
jgi:hypothetical protein